ncbi:D-alanyl-D-alanine carboxypeptidase family protein [Parvularcula lutaonensis]|uniref:serine-type D-Ala-D-Ala carboxypeptidase n=1 Tax=Parvularcula lutaonensis TaxID=491923 RepID=A0ABV7MBN0_9PROT|nr:D-alanyl-D-alanine carboxypeptidase family protein [Parvularcula lutaonensis]GGY40801.1 D-alanyl-D-alanine carboxypeptidase [Parvularcula lutaonensis]
MRLWPATVLSLALVALQPATAQNEDLIRTTATHAAIMDVATGELLYGKDAATPVPPASMSKLMTVAVVLDLIEQGKISLETPFYVSEKAWKTGGSKMFVLVDTQITVENLLKGIIVQSGNDACIVVAENIAGSEEAFAELMNARARAWGLEDSSFANPTGLPHPDQRMSMRDLAKLARHIWFEYPEYRYLFSIPEFTWSNITQANRNPLIGTMEGAKGMKTGHTEEAGYGVVGLAERDGEARIVVVTGLDSEAQRRRTAIAMMDEAFEAFETKTFFSKDQVVGTAEVFAGKADTVPLRIDQDITYTTHKRILAGAEAEIVYDGPLRAPLRAGEQVAVLRFELPGDPVREFPLYTAEPVKGLGVFEKIGLGLNKLLTPPPDGASSK